MWYLIEDYANNLFNKKLLSTLSGVIGSDARKKKKIQHKFTIDILT